MCAKRSVCQVVWSSVWCSFCLNQTLFLPAKLILPIRCVSSPVLQKILPFSPPCRSLWKIIGVHWECYWFSLAVLREKVSFIFSKIQTKEEKIGHVLEGLSHPIFVCFVFSSPFLVFSSTLFCLSLLLACQSSFCLCSFFLNSLLPIHILTIFIFLLCSCFSVNAAAVFLVSVLYVRHQVIPSTGHTRPHIVPFLYLQLPLWVCSQILCLITCSRQSSTTFVTSTH